MHEFLIAVIISLSVYFVAFDAGKNTRKAELEQKLCQLKQYEYCTHKELEELLKKTIK